MSGVNWGLLLEEGPGIGSVKEELVLNIAKCGF